jgi:2-polyprenyl-6-methoxyphenol hydroxylase-like FAD-dependent oxidoreductase
VRVVIVGGGIGGLSLALALRQREIACEVIEREPGWTTVGAGITFYPNGMRALGRLGLATAVEQAGVAVEHVSMRDRSGREVGVLPGEVWPGVGRTVAIYRPALQRILVDALGAVPVRMGTTIASIAQTAPSSDALEVTLSDGSSFTAPVLIGADGIRSRVRELAFGRTEPTYVGQMYWRGAIAGDVVDTATMLFDEGRFVALLPIGSGMTYVALQLNSPRPLPSANISLFEDFGGPVPSALEELRKDSSLHYGPAEEIERDEWRKGRVVLIGDAAHACSPTLAQGGGLAIEDAVVLADHLSRGILLEETLDGFVRRREPRARWVRERTHRQIELLNAGEPHEALAESLRETYAVLAAEP